MMQRATRLEAPRPQPGPDKVAGRAFALLAALALAHCGFPEFGGFVDGQDASVGGDGGSSAGGSAGTGGEGGTAGQGGTGATGGAGGTAAGGTGQGGTGATGGTGGTGQGGTGATGGTGTGGTDTGGTGGTDTGGTGGTGATGGTGGDAGLDAPPEAALSLLNVWHLPTNPEPPTITMRNPLVPIATTTEVFVYVGEYRAEGEVASGSLVWWWSDGVASTAPQSVPLTYDSHNGNNDYWRAPIPMPSRLVGTFKYYVELVPANTSIYATTYLYGTDAATNKTATESVASAAPYRPTFRSPTASELVITEVMVNALGSAETSKEWFELFSTASVPVSLEGCLLADSADANTHTIGTPDLVLWPGVYSTLASSSNSTSLEGLTPDYSYGTGMNLSNSGDAVRVMLPDRTVIDSVVWTSSTSWPYHTDGSSMQYDTATPIASGNDAAAAWCESKKAYGAGTSRGTPAAPTDGCVP